MKAILSSLRELEGVNGTFVCDAVGQVYAYASEAIYDASLISQASKSVATAIDSVKLIQEDWETITVHFSEGRLLLRNIPSGLRKGGSGYFLVLIADSRLNLSFATVAIRVAIGKLKPLIDSLGGNLPVPTTAATASTSSNVSAGGFSPLVASPIASMVGSSPSLSASHTPATAPEIAGSGLSWSGLGGSSAMTASGVAVADAASSAVLTACTKCLAKATGPMAKVFVKDAVRQITGGQPFAKSMLGALITEVEKHIEDRDDAAQFRKTASKLS